MDDAHNRHFIETPLSYTPEHPPLPRQSWPPMANFQQSTVEPRPISVDSEPRLVEYAHFRAKFGRRPPKLADAGPNLGEIVPTLADVGPNMGDIVPKSPDFGPTRLVLSRNLSKLADFGLDLADYGPTWRMLVDGVPYLGTFGTNSAQFGRSQSHVGHNRPGLS